MHPSTEAAFEAIRHLKCPVHDLHILEGTIKDGWNITYKVCCDLFGGLVTDRIGDTLDEYFRDNPLPE